MSRPLHPGDICRGDCKLAERVVTLGGNRLALVRHVYLPSVTAWVPGNLKVAVGLSAVMASARNAPDLAAKAARRASIDRPSRD